ncbi:UNVERIFIED_CONTAM: 25S rRNA (cytosine-C(5))-methyltransferase NSUN5 [Sesamum latifolium]|uniref:25S rRNA (Cytosine-C(5))-methyltransferase NSUN5 n=1 Tax=Sesamum latifolium TaxID=2727402 RepID=A0AAW2SQ37_9LAMI
MARRKPITSATKERKPEEKRPSNAERSAYFARREAAKVLRSMLQGDARRRAVGSIKSLVYSPSIRNKKATFALVCQTLKHLSLIKDVMDGANVLSAKWKKGSFTGDAEKYLMLKKDALRLALSRILRRKGVKDVEDLVALDKVSELRKPRYVRVNTLKIDTEFAIRELRQQYAGKASSMAAVALGPKPGWEVIDACSAPGNKTVHLAALMKGEGKILACELNKERVKRLKDNVKLAGATNVKVMHEDFLNLDPRDPSYSKVRAILLDPSCSGSGTAFERLDHLLPSHNADGTDPVDITRLQKLAGFQKKVLEHALSSEHLLRTDLTIDKEGFFIALFVRKGIHQPEDYSKNAENRAGNVSGKSSCRTRKPLNIFIAKMLKVSPHQQVKLSRKTAPAPASKVV